MGAALFLRAAELVAYVDRLAAGQGRIAGALTGLARAGVAAFDDRVRLRLPVQVRLVRVLDLGAPAGVSGERHHRLRRHGGAVHVADELADAAAARDLEIRLAAQALHGVEAGGIHVPLDGVVHADRQRRHSLPAIRAAL